VSVGVDVNVKVGVSVGVSVGVGVLVLVLVGVGVGVDVGGALLELLESEVLEPEVLLEHEQLREHSSCVSYGPPMIS